MTVSAYDTIVQQIYASTLTPKSQLAALGMLGAATNGALVCTKERTMQLCGVTSWGAARRMLGKIQASGLIHYRTNEMVYVAFMAYFADDLQRDGVTLVRYTTVAGDQPRAQSDQPRALFDHEPPDEKPDDDDDDDAVIEKRSATREKRAPEITFRSTTREKRASEAGGKGLGWVGYDLDQDPDLGSTPQPNPPPEEPPDLSRLKPDQRWAYELLVDPDIGIVPKNAVAAVRHHTGAYVVKQAAAWWKERETLGVGVLFWRLMNPGRYKPGPASAEFLDSDLYRRHYPLDERQLSAWAAYQQYLATQGAVNGLDHYVAIVQAWPPTLRQLAEQLPPPPAEGGAP